MLAFPPEMELLSVLWLAIAAVWVLFGSGWLTVELMGTGLPLNRRERLVAGFVLSAAWVGLLQALVLATTGRLTTVLHGLLFLTLGQVLLLGAKRLDVRRVSKRAAAERAKEPKGSEGPAHPGSTEVGETREPPPSNPFSGESLPTEPPWARWGLPALLLLSALIMLVMGGRLGFIHDSLDVVAYVREVQVTDSILPETSVYSPDPLPGPDPRRGTFHTQLALIARASGVDETDVWRLLPVLLVPMALLALYLLTLEIVASPAIALLSALLFAWMGILSAENFLQNIGYASRIGWIAGWVGWLAAHRYLRLGSWKLAFLAVLTAPALMGVHILSSAQYLAVLGCLTLAVWLSAPKGLWKRALAITALGVLVTLPFLAGRLLTSYDILNPIFSHPQGLMYLGGGWATMHPGEVLRILGVPGLCAAGFSLLLWKQRRFMRGAAVLFVAAWVPLLVVVFPPTLMLLEHFHAHSLTFRLLLIIPTSTVLAWAVLRALGDLRARKRLVASLGILAVTTLSLYLHSEAALGRWTLSPSRRAAWEEQEGLVKALSWLEQTDAEPRVILTDPLTSYAIPAYTQHHTVAPFHQHSSPTDSSALTRMEDAQAALNGFVGIRETCRILDRYRVDVVLLNQGFRRIQSHFGMFLSPLVYDIQRVKFGAYPGLFSKMYEDSDIIIYSYAGGGFIKKYVQGESAISDSLVPEDSMPPDSLWAVRETPAAGTLLGIDLPPGGGAPGDTLVVRVQDPPLPYHVRNTWGREGPSLFEGGGVELLGMDEPVPVRAGAPLRLAYYWRAKERPPLPVECVVMLSLDPPAGYLRFPLQPFLRRIWEAGSGEVYRFGMTHMPLQNFYPPFLWEPGEVYYDVVFLWIPPMAVPGRYEIHLKTRPKAFTDNWEIVDMIWDEGSLVGPAIAEVEILPRDGAAP